MKIKIQKLHPDAIVPTYATDGSGCFDLRAVDTGNKRLVDPTLIIRTGLAFEIPEGYAMLIFSRSGHGFNHETRLANCVGVIDSDYRGEVLVKLTVDWRTGNPLYVKEGDRIAQAMLVEVPKVEFDLVKELPGTTRGFGGFGSTGA